MSQRQHLGFVIGSLQGTRDRTKPTSLASTIGVGGVCVGGCVWCAPFRDSVDNSLSSAIPTSHQRSIWNPCLLAPWTALKVSSCSGLIYQ